MSRRRAAAELAGAWALAGAAPLLDLFGRSPTYFVALRASPAEVVAFAAAIALGPPLLLLAALEPFRRGSAAGAERLQRAGLGVLAALAVSVPLERAGLGDAALAAGLATGASVAALAAPAASLRRLAAYAAPALLVVPAAFLLRAEVRPLVRPPPPSGPAAARVERPAPVVMVVFDELPLATLLGEDGEVDALRFPAFAELSRASTWYAGAVASATATDLAVPALLTGRRPRAANVPPVLPSHPLNLFTLLPADHAVRAVETATSLCPRSRCGRDPPAAARTAGGLPVMLADAALAALHLAAPPSLERRLPSMEGRWGGFWRDPDAPRAPASPLDAVRFPEASFRAFVDGLHGGGGPRLDFLHVNVPHMPLRFLPGGERYASGREQLPAAWGDEPTAVATAHRRHLLAAGFADRLLGELLARLRERGLWERALVVVTSDHGVAFRPGRSTRTPGPDTVGEIAPVPLFVKAPGQAEGRRDDRPFEAIDVLPLVARELGLPLPPGVEGTAAPAADRVHVLLSSDGAVTRLPAAEAREALRSAVRRKVAAFGAGPWERLFASGTRPELVGTALAPAAPARPARRARVDEAAALASVDPASGFVPALLGGTVPPGLREPLAIALNGRVAAVLPPGAIRGGRFEALVPWSFVRPGRNEVRLALVDLAAGGAPREELLLEGEPALEAGVLRGADGAPIPLRAADPSGALEEVRRAARTAFVSGWALAEGGGRAEVLVFVGERLAARARTGSRRADLEARLGARHATAGFAADVELLDGEADAAVRAWALSPAGHAAALPLSAPRAP